MSTSAGAAARSLQTVTTTQCVTLGKPATAARSIALHLCVHLDEWVNFVSPDQPRAHEFTYHTRHPSPAPGVRSASAPGNCSRIPWGTVPKSPIGTTGSFPRIDSSGSSRLVLCIIQAFLGPARGIRRIRTKLCERGNESNNSNNLNDSNNYEGKQNKSNTSNNYWCYA